jgi:protein TonB
MTYPQERTHRIAALAAVLSAHAGVLALLFSQHAARHDVPLVTPVTVTFVQPSAVHVPQAAPQQKTVARPRVEAMRPAQPAPVIAAPQSVAAREPAPAQPVTPAAIPAPAALNPPTEPATAAPVTAAVAPPVEPPSFNADYLNNPAPAYPLMSRRMQEEGRVVLRVFVDAHGLPDRVELRSSSGHMRLDEVALDTVKHWKFVPARRGSEPVPAWVLVPISFNLRS